MKWIKIFASKSAKGCNDDCGQGDYCVCAEMRSLRGDRRYYAIYIVVVLVYFLALAWFAWGVK